MAENELVTVFRSGDASAIEDAEEVRQILEAEGIEAKIFDDSAPGVISGVIEVRVTQADASRAEAILTERPVEGDMSDADPSAVLDPVTVFQSSGSGEAEALAIEGMLLANGIQPIRVGTAAIPSLNFEIRVAKEFAEQAEQLIANAQATGGSAADEEERAGESA
jgi:hypothetical protein